MIRETGSSSPKPPPQQKLDVAAQARKRNGPSLIGLNYFVKTHDGTQMCHRCAPYERCANLSDFHHRLRRSMGKGSAVRRRSGVGQLPRLVARPPRSPARHPDAPHPSLRQHGHSPFASPVLLPPRCLPCIDKRASLSLTSVPSLSSQGCFERCLPKSVVGLFAPLLLCGPPCSFIHVPVQWRAVSVQISWMCASPVRMCHVSSCMSMLSGALHQLPWPILSER